ncbi:hypothetical protein ACH5RR_023402 [Cinchona calisaya]|uniref:Uncharacterized protein n=1 Tax=Cinchona calisaya TaxID=153742 RepID=A0ABD2ZAK5_9GENT
MKGVGERELTKNLNRLIDPFIVHSLGLGMDESNQECKLRKRSREMAHSTTTRSRSRVKGVLNVSVQVWRRSVLETAVVAREVNDWMCCNLAITTALSLYRDREGIAQFFCSERVRLMLERASPLSDQSASSRKSEEVIMDETHAGKLARLVLTGLS